MSVQILTGDCRDVLRTLPDESVHCVVTSPPYWGLRDYGTAAWEGGNSTCEHKSDLTRNRPDLPPAYENSGWGIRDGRPTKQCPKCGARRIDNQLGLERSLGEHVQAMVEVFREVRRVLRKDGTLWLNYGSSYASGDTTANQSRQLSRVPACGNGDKEPLGSAVAGPACPDCGGELLACSLSHHDRIARKSQLSEQRRRRHETKGHDNERSALEAGSHAACDVLPSTNLSSSANAQDVCGHEAKVSPARLKRPTSSDDVPPFVDNSVCMSGIALRDRPSFDCKSDKAFVCTACGYSTRMYPPHKPKDLVNVPFFVAEALRADGWYLRSDIIWSKCNPMPESVTDRPTKAHEYLFLLTKAERYYYDAEAIKEPASENTHPGYSSNGAKTQLNENAHGVRPSKFDGYRPNERNKRTVWEVATAPFNGSHLLADYVAADGTPYRRSEDCPIHGRSDGRQTRQMVADDGQLGHPSPHNHDNGVRHEPVPSAAHGAILSTTNDKNAEGTSRERDPQNIGENRTLDQSRMLGADVSEACAEFPSHIDGTPRSPNNLDCETGSGRHDNCLPAIGHSNGNHRTAHDLETNPAYNASVEMIDRIGDKSVSPELFDLAGHMPASSNAQVGLVDHPSAQKSSRTARKSSPSRNPKCTCERMSTDHFATFPPALIEPCIKAGTSEKGCCAKCGASWVRKVERTAMVIDRSGRTHELGQTRSSGTMLEPAKSETIGWSRSCSCDVLTIPCTVLDPFGGAGTTGLVADRLQRNAILIELNPEYAAMARRRIDGDAPLFSSLALPSNRLEAAE